MESDTETEDEDDDDTEVQAEEQGAAKDEVLPQSQPEKAVPDAVPVREVAIQETGSAPGG